MQSSNHDFLCWCYVLRWIWCLWCYSECISTPGKLEKAIWIYNAVWIFTQSNITSIIFTRVAST
jgi:hypothetical protein